MMLLHSQIETDSTTIKRCFYDHTKGILKVEFNSGSLYEYEGVPSEVYDSLCKAESQGRFFNESIKSNYSHNKLLNS
jgi:hypothetical protein